MVAKIDRTGEMFKTNQGYEIVITCYNSYNNVIVEFGDEYKATLRTTYRNCLSGTIKNPFHKSVIGVGATCGLPTKINGKHTSEYKLWRAMLVRCYDPYYLNEHSTYRQVTVCERWKRFDHFCNDIKLLKNYDKWLHGGYELDKDVIQQSKENKMYSIDTCIFIKQEENKGESNSRTKTKQVKCIDKDGNITFYKSSYDAERELGVSSGNVRACCSGNAKTHKGFRFEFV